ncbi:Por secretion system C-terminal sorting domain-containing protein [Bizionia echini]|uniref:Por secretion system C-terminal sorting domain-containing protein n=1 Tax=Bizionia echini TaxID=649333 RepID=A0A1I5DCY7_9FLAO|nr:T9SS type A sorting domain-containing protein [Bizionia echini]SFN97063.1 Por secretion system C-terminal sorting domain-containing protein [Bizionia echini]
MRKLYITTLLLLSSIGLTAQVTYEFSVSFVGINPNTNNYQMALLATPSESVTNNSTDDMGAGFYVPTGLTIGNFVTGNSNIPASEWASISMGPGAFGDAYFLGRDEAGQFSILLNGSGPFELVLFDVIADPNPSSGEIRFVENGDPVFDTIFIENYINIAAQNLYSQNNPLASAVSFQTLDMDTYISNRDISIYPNPVSNILHIKTAHSINAIEIYTLQGSLILKTTHSEINVNQFQSGTYILKVQTDLAQTVKKLIIK